MEIHKLWLSVAAIPKTVIFNFRYLPLKEALRFPFIVSHRVALQKMSGKIEILAPIRANMIRLGFHENPVFDRRERAVWHNTGTVVFTETAYIGNGNCIVNTGKQTIGNNFQMSGNSNVVCKYDTSFGDDVLIGWDCLFMDGDAHKVYTVENVGGTTKWKSPCYYWQSCMVWS